MSDFQIAEATLQLMRCQRCRGSGECNDADIGDIGYNTWTCRACKGSGYNTVDRMTVVTQRPITIVLPESLGDATPYKPTGENP